MKIKIGTFSIDFNEEVIKRSRKKAAYVASQAKSLEWTGIAREILTEKISEVYDLVKGAK